MNNSRGLFTIGILIGAVGVLLAFAVVVIPAAMKMASAISGALKLQ